MFPASSWELKPGSTQSIHYAQQLMALMDSMVAAAERGLSVEPVLEVRWNLHIALLTSHIVCCHEKVHASMLSNRVPHVSVCVWQSGRSSGNSGVHTDCTYSGSSFLFSRALSLCRVCLQCCLHSRQNRQCTGSAGKAPVSRAGKAWPSQAVLANDAGDSACGEGDKGEEGACPAGGLSHPPHPCGCRAMESAVSKVSVPLLAPNS